MHFIRRHRRVKRIAGAPVLHPQMVVPVVGQIPDDGSGARRSFRMKSEGIGFVDTIIVVTRYHMILVRFALPDTGNESFPYPGIPARMQFMAVLVPAIEMPHHIDL